MLFNAVCCNLGLTMNTNTNTNQNQNNNEHKSTVVDSPVMTGENDLLNLSDYRNALIDYFKHAQTPITISLQGEWGSGKTSLMRSLEDALCIKENSPFLSVWINTWQFSLLSNPSDVSNVIINILQSIVKQIAEKDPEDKFRSHADSTVSLIMKGVRFAYDIAGPALLKKIDLEKEDVDNAIANFKGTNTEKLQSNTKVQIDGRISLVEQLKDQINALVNEVLDCAPNKGIKQGFIFFIDDLDRIKPTLAVEILEILKNIFDFNHCISIIAVDYNVVIEGLRSKLGEKNNSYYRVYFDKLIQMQIAMPISKYSISLFLRKHLSDISFIKVDDSLDCDLNKFTGKQFHELIQIAERSVGTNPRKLKKLINSLSLIMSFKRVSTVLDNKTCDEIGDNSADYKIILFALACIQVAFPEIYFLMLNNPNFRKWSDEYSTRDTNIGVKFDKILAIKSSLFENEYLFMMNDIHVDEWEIYLFNLCNFKDNLKPRFADLLFILNKIDQILERNKQSPFFNVYSNVSAILSWLLLIDTNNN